jgi:hypothetical protein
MGEHIITIGSITNSAFVIGGGEVTIAGEGGDVIVSAVIEDQGEGGE